jgi:ribonuclease E
VVLRSGGYIVINQTEALVAIDVNSGKATREHNIEDTALKTNLEAAEEVARQLRLRDLAGLIVIDFIDMDERRNSRLVERRLKESLRNDRARIQVGRISHFGLLEMSRQRLRTGMLEGSTSSCTMCQGTGIVRSVESVALDVLRSLEDRLITDGVVPLVATTAVDVALYILNQKRSHLKDIEQRYRIPITVTADENLHVSQFVIERSAESEIGGGETPVVQMDWAHHHPAPAPAPAASAEGDAEQAKRRSRRRRRKRRGPGEQDYEPSDTAATLAESADAEEEPERERETESHDAQTSDNGGQNRKPRRRGRRGGRRGRTGQRPERAPGAAEGAEMDRPREASDSRPEGRDRGEARPDREATPQQNGDGRQGAKDDHPQRAERPSRDSEPAAAAPVAERTPAPAEIRVESESKEESAPPRRGWWQR